MIATMTTFANGTAQFDVSELWVDTVGVSSVDADWEALGGEYREGFESYEAPDCPECGGYAVWNGNDREWTCNNTDCARSGEEIDASEAELSGPMMNYYYPLPDLRRVGDDPSEAASRIRDLPLCVIQFSDGGYALALTGGGMDLSWEICEAFTRLGYLPPLRFADLPVMSGYPRDGDDIYVIHACMRSAEVAGQQAQRTLASLVEHYNQ